MDTDISHTGADLSTEKGRKDWHEEVAGDLPPLGGTSEAALSHEIIAGGHRFSLDSRIAAYGNRPLAVFGASRGQDAQNLAFIRAARDAGNTHVIGGICSTDHPFSDRRIALSNALVT